MPISWEGKKIIEDQFSLGKWVEVAFPEYEYLSCEKDG